MIEVISITGTPVYVRVIKDADFKTYGWYYEVYAHPDDDEPIDWGNTYDPNEGYDDVLEWACNIAERTDYHI